MASSVATASSAPITNVLIASSAPAFARHLPFSMTPSSILKTNRVDSGGNSFKIAFVAAAAAWRTTSPLSMKRSKNVGRDESKTGAAEGPRTAAKDWNAMAADSRSYPDDLLVAKLWIVAKTLPSLERKVITQ